QASPSRISFLRRGVNGPAMINAVTDPDAEQARPRSLLALLDLTPIGTDVWTGPTPAEGPGRLFGGQVAGQALRAACNTVDPGPRVHSLHGYFIRPGRPNADLELHVERTSDGRS